MTTDMQQLEAELRDSINHYDQILTVLQNIDKEMGTASHNELQNMNASLAELQDQATHLDQSILCQINRELAKTETICFLLDKRENIVKEILLLNGNITAKASGVKYFIAHEMGKLRDGISALSGYRQQQHNQGRIVKTTS